MGCRVQQILLVACFFLLICIAVGWSTKELSVCPGGAASFSYKYNPEGYRRLKYIFTEKDGQPLVIWKIKFDEQKPTLHKDYEERFTITSAPAVGFTLQNVSSADIGNYMCYILYPNGTNLYLRWNLHLKDSTELRKPRIVSKNESEYVIYTCSHNETVEVDKYWKWDGVERVNGWSLAIYGKNPKKIECIIKTSCNNNSVTKDCSSSRRKRSTSEDDYGSCSYTATEEGTQTPSFGSGLATEEEEGTQTPSFGLGIGIGIVIGILIGFLIGTITVFCILNRRNRRKRNGKKDAADQQQPLSIQEEGKD